MGVAGRTRKDAGMDGRRVQGGAGGEVGGDGENISHADGEGTEGDTGDKQEVKHAKLEWLHLHV